MYDDTHQLLVMVVADEAIDGVGTLRDLRQIKVPDFYLCGRVIFNSNTLVYHLDLNVCGDTSYSLL